MQTATTTHIPFFSRLRLRLTALFLVVAIIPIVLITTIVARQVEAQSRSQIFNQLESISILKSQQIDQWLQDGREQLALFLVSLQHDSVTQESLFEHATSTVRQIADASTSIDDIFFYNPQGEVIFSSDEVLVGRVVNRQYYFDASLVEDHLQAPFFDVSSGTLALIATSPVYAGDELIGVAAIRYNTEELNQIMFERTGLGETGETYLVSRENNYFLTASRFEGYLLNRAYTSVGIEQALAGQDGSSVYGDYRSPAVPVFGNYRWIPELEGGLLTEINEEEALSALNQAQVTIVILAIIVSAIVVFVGFIVTNILTRPISQITNSASAIAQGHFDQRVLLTRSDEIGVLATAFNNMAQAVQDRTQQMEEARDEALAAQRIARENSRLKSEFLSTMSHELRTPLNAIEGFTSIMLSGMGIELSPRAEDMVRRVSMNSKRLLQLINDFLDLSRIEAGRLELVKSPVSPEGLAHKWQNEVSVLAEGKGLEFIVNIDPNLPPIILGDEDALSKVAINLLGNAFKFTQQGQVTLELSCISGGWKIAVSDTGIGIPSHAREYIFEEFRQVDGSSKRLYGGTGLGLSLVQKLSRAMGGNVSLQSEVGKGSIFTVTLPLEVETIAQGAAV
ncbi:MAG: HAMP domain-containing protein [Burkholderiales bacterium]|nr:HAMP domain-containing protein [Anaerolineae bacterium]